MVGLRPSASVRSRPARASHRLCSAFAFLIACVPAGSRAQPSAQADTSPLIPAHVHVTPCLRRTVEDMLRRSETFRTQMAAIAAAPGVGIAIVMQMQQSGPRAAGIIRRYTTGALVASIFIRSVADQPELLAHEIEHVREQIEGVPVARLARTSNSAWLVGGTYETERAIAAGRRVRAEMRAADTPTP
jgi:hypothetical protein